MFLDLELNLDLNMVIKENVVYGYVVANAFSYSELFKEKNFFILRIKVRHSRPGL